MLDLFDGLGALGVKRKVKVKKARKLKPRPLAPSVPQLPTSSVSDQTKRLVLGGSVLLVLGAVGIYLWRSR